MDPIKNQLVIHGSLNIPEPSHGSANGEEKINTSPRPSGIPRNSQKKQKKTDFPGRQSEKHAESWLFKLFRDPGCHGTNEKSLKTMGKISLNNK